MKITEISVKKPAAITMVILLFIGLGIIGYKNMGADLLPSMNIPIITVSTTYSGASAEDVKKDIIKPIEDAVSGISGIDKINSQCREGYGLVIISFKSTIDMNSALIDVQKSVDNASSKLPQSANKPVLYKADINDMPILTLALTGNVSYDELYNEADKVKESIQKIPGIGKVDLQGANKKQLMIKLDKTALEYYRVNINTLIGKLKSDNINIPSGEIKHDNINESIRVNGEFQNIDEIKNILIPTLSGGAVRLNDISEIKLETPEPASLLRLNDKNTISISIQKQSDANVVEAVNKVKKELENIKKNSPSEIDIKIANDTTTFINASLSEIKRNLIEGIITTAIVLYLFFRSWRSSIITLVAIPTSLISTFFMMYQFKFTLNMMSLMALSLCIGTLVDDSIVVLENIQRHLSMGKTPVKAAIEGREEIGMAAIAITLCDVVVFAPIAFMSGITGEIFKEFGLTIIVATLFSLVVSFTVTPMLASILYKKKTITNENVKKKATKINLIRKIENKISNLFEGTVKLYKKILIWSLDNRGKVLTIVFIMIVFSISLIPMKFINSEFIPQTDQSSLTINLSLTPGSSLNKTNEKIVQVENYLKTLPEVKDYFSTVGNNNNKASGEIIVQLVSKNQRKKSQNKIAQEVRDWGKKLPGVDFNISEKQMGSGGSSKPIVINIMGNNSDTLKDLSNKIESLINTIPGVIDVSNSSKTKSSELKVKVDRLAASQYGVSISDVASLLRTGIEGTTAGTYRTKDDEYDIKLKFTKNEIKTTEDVGSIKITNSSGQQIPLSQIASIVQEDGQQSISREDRQDIVTVSSNIQGRVLSEVSGDINKKLKFISVPTGYSINFGGSQEQMTDAFSALIKALAASIILVYMILVVLYESFLTPFIRMLALPCAIIGALFALAITGKSLNLMSMIGLIMLDGLASKNGTLLIDYTNTLMKNGMSLKDALIESGVTRLRPIIMTSVTMIVGMLPAALSLAEGSETKSSMAVVVIGGMIVSTILSPIVLPVVYTIMDDMKKALFKKNKKTSHIMEVE
ncbi:HAE1 family hydrophobic/amphiphilic exporter-1 [Clostridium tetanomorphum]|uniref:Efflux RND transporter permease subunit n=1 Tax=Clostridium tetanomorphum TaxID=1553 RepID=A0A923E829_CLOTT|nr:efflux RND transporter permease subunit [Clostridium tetanomorphum]KAJ49080.1 cation/multidrug efflux pump [Clostridium tetanomorphum DSM 665]KAJ52952.1 cation/multidrug efflux pump [Clostridium tetanomorphum DSM 665]MBC2398205.1 efflux RND transporter permease subunit [Clostridium tetanomorphum]MBP1864892.1 HAE1 family hydrophobic/amphiphilic exporter-1 [Clostridium tetanomorphum]NRS83098.1 HAE1 family hydrophobic/amphiphilic exporter-1 [Clostridium tetanomorphum]